MTSQRSILMLAAASLALSMPAPAEAEILNTFVSKNGLDTNNCAFSTPCRSLARAVSQTSNTGIATCLDTADYTGLTQINRSIIIDCGGAAATAGPFVIDSPGVQVTIKNLSISFVLGPAISFLNGAGLIVENVRVTLALTGISFTPSAGVSYLAVRDTLIDSAPPNFGPIGVSIAPTGSGVARVDLDHLFVLGRLGGVLASAPSGTQITLTMRESELSNNSNYGFVSAGNVLAVIDSSAISNNANIGVYSSGGAASWVYVGKSTITGNNIGWAFATGSNLVSYKNNNVTNASTFGAPSATVAQQ